MRKNKWVLFLFAVFFSVSSLAQYTNFGVPFNQAITKKEYQAGPQNWDIIQDQRGVIFMANNDGLLVFNSRSWHTYPLPNRTILRSIALGGNGWIYAGGQNELGYYHCNDQGEWAYRSLKHLLPAEYLPFEDVWGIELIGDTVYYQTAGVVFQYAANRFNVIKHPGEQVRKILLAEDQLYLQLNKTGLYVLKESVLLPVDPVVPLFTGSPVTGIHSLNDQQQLITTLFDGAFLYDGTTISPWVEEYQSYFMENRIYSSTVVHDGRVLIGTSGAGLFIFSVSGEILQHIHTVNGLLNNKVLSLFVDSAGHVWAGLDNGLNYLKVNSPFSRVFPGGNDQVAGYEVVPFEEKLYFATADGVFYLDTEELQNPLRDPVFRPVRNTVGQAWGLDRVGDELFLAHHRGSFRIMGDRALKIEVPGAWGTWTFSSGFMNENLLISGGYKGIYVYERQADSWVFRKKLENFSESSRFLVFENERTAWVAHPYQSIYKLEVDIDFDTAEVRGYGKKNGLNADVHNHVFLIFNDLVFCSDKGIFKYQAELDSFIPYESYNRLFGSDKEVIRLFEGVEEDIWFVTEDEIGRLLIRESSLNKELVKTELPPVIREELVGGFEMISPVDNKNVFIGSNNGFIHYNPSFSKLDVPAPRIFFDAIHAVGERDSLISRGLFTRNDSISSFRSDSLFVFPDRMNGFRFSYAGDRYFLENDLEFSYRLLGTDENWSGWSTNQQKEFTNLSPGNYNFQVKAKDGEGRESNPLEFRFAILPPWYLTGFAKFLYFLLLFVLAGFLFLRLRHRFRMQDKRVSQSEQEIENLKREKLEAEIAHKNRELVSTAIHLHQQNDLHNNIKNRLTSILKESDEGKIRQNLARVVKLLESEEKSNDDWEKLEMHFNEIHTGFFDRLRKDFPDLTRRDLRLAAYLRINLSTKEIATLLNNTVRGVEGGRYRLRRKLGLDQTNSLSRFLSKY
jgi:DNA-binding CsgD family transcriptional regulator